MKAYFVDFDGCVPYEINVHAALVYKFLFWEKDETLLAGSSHFKAHSEILKEAHQNAPNEKANGAGEIFGSEIMYWDSIGYNILTPEKLRPIIVKIIGVKDGCL
ncbi:hypothetical protein KKB98_02200 [Patescibacteria group bacterium]|nr:hypothetical protein [Patescibacteria group bacterium]